MNLVRTLNSLAYMLIVYMRYLTSSGNGEIHFPAYFKKGCVRNLCTDRKKNLPVTLGVSLYSISAKHLQ